MPITIRGWIDRVDDTGVTAFDMSFANFITAPSPLGQTTREWYDVSVNSFIGDVYACVNGGDIYKQTGGTGNFVALNQTTRAWWGIEINSSNGDVYASVYGGDIYKQTAGNGDFVIQNAGTRNWIGISVDSSNGNVYACVNGGDIYKQTAGNGDFVALSQTPRAWWGIDVNPTNKDVYATTAYGDIYKQTAGNGDFVALSQTTRYWRHVAIDPTTGDVYAVASVANMGIYKQTGGSGNFVEFYSSSGNWYGVDVNPTNGDMYACVSAGDIHRLESSVKTGDLLLAFISKDDDDDMSSTSSMTEVVTIALAASHSVYAFWKIATESDVARGYVSFSGDSEDYIGRLYVIKAGTFDATNPIDVVDSTGATGTTNVSTTPSITVVTDGALVFSVVGYDDNDIPYRTSTRTYGNAFNHSITDTGMIIAINGRGTHSVTAGTAVSLNGTINAIGQSFLGNGRTLIGASFDRLTRYPAGTAGNAVAKIYAHTGTFGTSSLPTGTALATSESSSVAKVALDGVLDILSFVFSGANQILLENNVPYVLVMEFSGSGSNYLTVYPTGDATESGNPCRYTTSWATITQDFTIGVHTDSPIGATGTVTNTQFASDGWAGFQIAVRSWQIPNKPTLVSPESGSTVSDTTPSFRFIGTDNNLDSLEYNIRVYSNTVGGFLALSSLGSPQYVLSIAVNSLNKDVYIGESNITNYGRIRKLSGGDGNLVTQDAPSPSQWTGISVNPINNDVYACTAYIYKQSGGIGQFTQVGTLNASFRGISVDSSNKNVYTCVMNGDIYKQTGGTGNFVALSQTTRWWHGISVDSSNQNVYACAYNGDIYKQTAGSGNFVALSQTTRNWSGISVDSSNHDVYACVYNGDIYKQTGGIGNFVSLGVGTAYRYGIAVNPSNKDVYTAIDASYLYKASRETLIDANSSTDSGFENITTPADTHPFNSGNTIQYTVQAGDTLTSGTYYWDVKAIDP